MLFLVQDSFLTGLGLWTFRVGGWSLDLCVASSLQNSLGQDMISIHSLSLLNKHPHKMLLGHFLGRFCEFRHIPMIFRSQR